jgi:branched-subunit amino acid transport protein
MIWVAVLSCAAGCYLLKLAGLSIPSRFLEKPLVQRLADLLPIALLAALIAVQVFSSGSGSETSIAIDARLAGLAAAVVALLLRAPFLVVVLVAAGTAAGLRLL